jgi:hypothetical protein
LSPGPSPRMKPLLAVPLLLLTALALAGCGPIHSTALLLDAEVQLQAAKTAGADQYAPYEWTAANLYIKKAREEVGYSDYEVAVDFAQKAARFAKEARDRAMSSSKRDEAGPVSGDAP